MAPLDLVCDKISTNAVKKLSTPANASEAPSVAKVWQQVKDNAPTFATVWGLVFATGFLGLIWQLCLQLLAHPIFDTYPADVFSAAAVFTAVGSLPTTILANLVYMLMVAVPAIYYATDQCPGPGETLRILTRKPLRYLLAGFLFAVAVAVGLLLCIIPGILVGLTTPLYVYYVFTTDLDLINCLSKAFKGMFQDFGSYLVVSLLCGLAVIASILLCFLPSLVVLPMTALYIQNYIHHKGLVRAREVA